MIKRKQKEEIKPVIIDVYNQEGVVVSKKELPGDIFNVPVSEELVHFAVTVQRANARSGTSATKTRGEVRGGGKKPWKQKGTGRSRHGSIRSPLWKGGGVVFGPRPNQNWTLRINKKVKRKALCMVLSDKVKEGAFIALDALMFGASKTKEAVALLSRLPLGTNMTGKRGRIGVIIPPRSPELARSLRNIPSVNILSPNSMNVVALLKCRRLIAPLKSIDEIIAALAKK